MLEHIHIENYRSFVEASAKLSPFTLVIGANASGKTNFLRLFRDLNRGKAHGYALDDGSHPDDAGRLMPHFTLPRTNTRIRLKFENGEEHVCSQKFVAQPLPWPVGSIDIFSIDPDIVAQPEQMIPDPFVEGNGAGTARVFDTLKSGDREDLAIKIETVMKRFVPGIEKVSTKLISTGVRAIQIRETGFKEATPGRFLSAGTRILLALITIVHQPSPPPLLLIDDIDHGLHPRLLAKLLEFLQDATRELGIQVIATTHNANVVNHFLDNPEAVLLVEKENGGSTITPLSERLAAIDYDKADAPDMPLGDLWFGGFVGGVPKFNKP